jgi:hypothetical protein
MTADALFTQVRPRASGRSQLALADRTVFTAEATLDWPTGRTRYRVVGPRITGSFVVYADADPEEMDPAQHLIPRVDFGVAPAAGGDFACFQDRPQVNGITLQGSHLVRRWQDSVGAWREPWCYLGRNDESRAYREVPEATRLKTAQICHALITTWLTMPEWPALVHARLAHIAPVKLAALTEQVQELHRRSTDLMVAIGQCEQSAGAWTLLTALPTTLGTARDAGARR